MSVSEKNLKPLRVGIEGVSYSLAHVPDLVRFGSKPLRELRGDPALAANFAKLLRDFPAAIGYAPHQVYIGNIDPVTLRNLPQPWYEKLIEGAMARGRFGDLVEQAKFYALLAGADGFDLVCFEEKWFQAHAAKYSIGRPPRLKTLADIQNLCDKGALSLYSGPQLVGAFESAHEEDASLAAEVLLENLSGKVSAAHALRLVLAQLELKADDVDFVISCSEEAVGDRYNRGGGNLAKAIAEDVGCGNASGCDVKAFCAGPMYAMVQAASMIQAGVAKKVAVVAGGSLAKLGMKFESHVKKNMPILEDMIGSFAAILSLPKAGQVCMRLDSAAFHPVRAGGSPQAMAEELAEKPLAKLGMRLTDVDRYGVELHNPEITVPSGSGDVPRTNYLTLAALAVMRGQIPKNQMDDFVRSRGMLGYAPTQGHIPSAIVYLGHAKAALEKGEIRNALLMAKGSLFLGRMTQLSDGCSFLLDRNE
ncbi:MAG TPA: glycine/sarcosine/betaine reductase complex component C subunit beta [Candidatus Limnocylindrales bacterium]|nr:glycine/sarcosine/betaine reductase complex component C subunit beta [Candidatus Limnocylindrales bacterium]